MTSTEVTTTATTAAAATEKTKTKKKFDRGEAKQRELVGLTISPYTNSDDLALHSQGEVGAHAP